MAIGREAREGCAAPPPRTRIGGAVRVCASMSVALIQYGRDLLMVNDYIGALRLAGKVSVSVGSSYSSCSVCVPSRQHALPSSTPRAADHVPTWDLESKS